MAEEEVGKGRVVIEADTKGLGKDIAKKVDSEGSGIGKAFGKIGNIAGTAFKAAAVAGIAGVFAAGAFAKGAVDAASDLAESTSKINVVFGDAGAAIIDWSKNSAAAFGQSQQAALEAAGTYGNLFQAFGVGQKPAQEMSQTLVELASDLASFNNTSVEDALTAIQSGLSGETEPLKRYGAVLSDVRLKEEALAQGLITSTKDALTPAAKAQAAYALIMKDTQLAQGDFARTSDGLANQQKILGAQWTNMKASIGKVLIPAMLALVSFLSKSVIPTIQTLWEGLVDWFQGEQFAAIWQTIRDVLGTVVDFVVANWPLVTAAFQTVVDTIVTVWNDHLFPVLTQIGSAFAAAFTWLMDNKEFLIGAAIAIGAVLVTMFVSWAASATAAAIATAAAAAPIYLAVLAIAAVVGGLIYAYNHFETFRNIVDAVARFFRDVWIPLMLDIWSFIVNTLVPAIVNLAQTVATILVNAWQALIAVVQTVWGWLQTLWDRSEGVRGFLAGAFRLGVEAATNAFAWLRSAVESVWSWIQTVWDRTEGFRSFLAAAFWLALTVVRTAFDNIVTALSSVWNWLQSAWDKSEGFRSFLADVFKGALDGIKGAFDLIASAIGTVVSKIQAVIDKAKAALGPIQAVIDAMNKINPFNKDITTKIDLGGPDLDGNALGGKVWKGVPSIVGERGPEVFTPTRDGWIIPRHDIASLDIDAMSSAGVTGGRNIVGAEIHGNVNIYDATDLDGFARTLEFQLAGAL